MDKKVIYSAICSICMPAYYTRMFENMHEGIDETFRDDVKALGFENFDKIVRNDCEIEGALNDLYGQLKSAESNYFTNFVATAVSCRTVRHKTAYIPVNSPVLHADDDSFGDWVYDTVLTAFKDHDLNECEYDAREEFNRVVASNEDRFVMRDGKMYREVTYVQMCDDYGTELEYNCPAYYVFNDSDQIWFELADSTEQLDVYDIESKLIELAKNNRHTDMTIHLLCSPYHNADNGEDYVISEQIIKKSGHADNLLALVRGYSDYL